MVIPCLNEAASIERCVTEARRALEGQGWEGEVIVADNGSDDRSAELARGAGALVVHEPQARLRKRIPRRASPPRRATTS